MWQTIINETNQEIILNLAEIITIGIYFDCTRRHYIGLEKEDGMYMWIFNDQTTCELAFHFLKEKLQAFIPENLTEKA